jgi:RNA polymerase sigma-70 factor (ECF subfamily)
VLSIEQVSDALADPADDPATAAERAEQARLLVREIERLPADQRDAVNLRFFAGLRTVDVARAMGRSEGAVKMLVYRAVSHLRAVYGENRREDVP